MRRRRSRHAHAARGGDAALTSKKDGRPWQCANTALAQFASAAARRPAPSAARTAPASRTSRHPRQGCEAGTALHAIRSQVFKCVVNAAFESRRHPDQAVRAARARRRRGRRAGAARPGAGHPRRHLGARLHPPSPPSPSPQAADQAPTHALLKVVFPNLGISFRDQFAQQQQCKFIAHGAKAV